jgi:nucleoside-diphosphate-sugar epimerase
MAKCLVTGGAGFIGSNLSDELIKNNYEVIIIDNLLTGKIENINPNANFYNLDIRNLDKITPLFKGIDYVFHMAAYPRIQVSIDDPKTTNEINVCGTINVLLAARDAEVKKIIYSGSSSAYGRQDVLPWNEIMSPKPFTPYGLQKYVGEQYSQIFNKIYGLPAIILRYFNVYGNRQSSEGAYCSVVSTFIKQKLAGELLTIIGDGEQRRDFTFVGDVVRANMLAAFSEKINSGEIINIGGGKNYSVNQIATIVGGQTKNLPPRIEIKESLADINLAEELLGWKPEENLLNWLSNYFKG